jgi:hypothetical protein
MGGGSGAPPAHTTPISCWLVPPKKPKAELSALVQKLASENDLPAFDVHITIIGDVLGEHCSSVAEAIERLQLLEHSGSVPCRFASIECFPPWNQSLMAVAEESPVRRYGQTRRRCRDRAPWPPTARGALPRAHVGPLRLRIASARSACANPSGLSEASPLSVGSLRHQ